MTAEADTPQGLPPQAIYPVSHDIATQLLDCVGGTPWLTCNVPVSVVKAAAEALAAQAATLESIHKIIECAGPEAAGEIADLLGYPSVEWPSDQAVSVPVDLWQGRCVYPGGFASEWKEIHPTKDEPTQELRAAYLASLTHPSGEPSYEIRKLYASAPPPASMQDEALVEKLAKRTCEANADSARFTIALQTLRASLDPDDWMGEVTMHNYIDAVLAGGSPLQQHPAPSPAQAVDAVPLAWQDTRDGLLAYVLQGDLHNRLTPRVIDIAYLAFMSGRSGKNADDGGPCDWFNDTKPMAVEAIGKVAAALQAYRQPRPQQDWALDVEALATKEPRS